ncbi:MAG: 50S ribosomal protein L9 [Verrucomicrobiota bacterium]|nr:50S ribosomal protein L9 [Verrucomicrobiota bacterium]
MPISELLLVKPVTNLGNEGDHVKVKPGYARNYLLPRGYAIPLTRGNRKQVDSLKKRSEARLKDELVKAQEISSKLQTIRIAIAVKTGPGGKVFGSVTAQNLIDRIAQDGVTLEKKTVHLHTPVKTLGKHTTQIKLHPEVSLDFEFEIVSENPIIEADSQS